MSNGECPVGAENKAKIEGIGHEMGQVWSVVSELRKDVKEALKEALRRPGWTTCVLISALCSLCVGLIVTLLNGD